MNLKSRLKKLLIIVSVSIGLLITAPVMAAELRIDIDGCLTTSVGSCGNTNDDNTVFASGDFRFWDTLRPVDPTTADLPFVASTSVTASDPADDADSFEFSQLRQFGNFAAFQADPNFPLALSIFQAVVSGTTLGGPGTPFPFEIMFDAAVTTLTDGNHFEGTFTASSESPLAGLDIFSNQLFGRDLPRIPVDFNANASLVAVAVAVSEPVSLALIGLGLFVMSSSLRRKI